MILSDAEFARALEGERKSMISAASRMVRHHAEDIVQDTMVRLWRARHQMNNLQTFPFWCKRSVERMAIDHLRRIKPVLSLSEDDPSPEDLERDVLDKIDARQTLDSLVEKMLRHASETNVWLILEYLESGTEAAETAERHGIRAAYLRHMVWKMRRHLGEGYSRRRTPTRKKEESHGQN